MIHNIYMAPTKKEANIAFDVFIEEFETRYPRAVDCLRDNRERLMTFYNYPAEHWAHIRSTNPIESTFATVRPGEVISLFHLPLLLIYQNKEYTLNEAEEK